MKVTYAPLLSAFVLTIAFYVYSDDETPLGDKPPQSLQHESVQLSDPSDLPQPSDVLESPERPERLCLSEAGGLTAAEQAEAIKILRAEMHAKRLEFRRKSAELGKSSGFASAEARREFRAHITASRQQKLAVREEFVNQVDSVKIQLPDHARKISEEQKTALSGGSKIRE